jgi:hypothetical protein
MEAPEWRGDSQNHSTRGNALRIEVKEANAIRFLRELLSPPATATAREEGTPDPGWCCTEHSVVASLAFIICGSRAFHCRGSLTLGDSQTRKVSEIDPHEFVLVEGSGVFDSSVSFETIKGIPLEYAARYPTLSVLGGANPPTRGDFVEALRVSGKRTLAWYVSSKMSLPNRRAVEWISPTPLGEWILAKYGTQAGVWAKAAWLTSEILKGTPLPSQFDRDSLWDLTISSPDNSEAVIGLCEKFISAT